MARQIHVDDVSGEIQSEVRVTIGNTVFELSTNEAEELSRKLNEVGQDGRPSYSKAPGRR